MILVRLNTAAATLAALLGFKKIMDSELGDVALKGLGLDEVSKAVKKNLKQLANEVKLLLMQLKLRLEN